MHPIILSEPESVGLILVSQGTEHAMHKNRALNVSWTIWYILYIHVSEVMIHKATFWGNASLFTEDNKNVPENESCTCAFAASQHCSIV